MHTAAQADRFATANYYTGARRYERTVTRDPGDRRRSNEERAARVRREPGAYDRLLSGLFYAIGQLILLCWPVLWLVFLTPEIGAEVEAAALVAVAVASAFVGALRSGLLSIGRPWPALTGAMLSVGTGYGEYLTRSVYLSCTLGFATYAGAFAQLATGHALATVPVAAVVSAGGVAAFPYLTGDALATRAVRLGYYAVALGLVFVGISGLGAAVREIPGSSIAFFLLYVVLALVDTVASGG